MKKKIINRALTTTALIVGFHPLMSYAQETGSPYYDFYDENGMSLTARDFKLEKEYISIGSGQQRLSYVVKLNYLLGGHRYLSDNNFSGNAYAGLDGDGIPYAYVYFDGQDEVFSGSGPDFSEDEPRGSRLNLTGSTLTYTRADGLVVKFDNSPGGAGRPLTINYPNGVKTYIAYKGNVGPYGGQYRIQSVRNNAGYMLKFGYPDATSTDVSSVTAINGSVDYCNPTADSCTGLSRPWPSMSISQTNASGPINYTITDANGAATAYTFSTFTDTFGQSIIKLTGIKYPGSSVDDVSLEYDSNVQLPTAITNGGRRFTYGLETVDGAGAIVRTDPSGAKIAAFTSAYDTGPVAIKNEVGQKVSYTYDSRGRITRTTAPEGNYTQYTYDLRNNVTEIRRVAKPGSGVVDIVTSASFPSTCANPLTCNKPTSVTDARGKTTDYTYDPTTGAVLTITSPSAVSGGTRPQIRFSYTQYQAYFKNSSSAIVASGEPISLLTGSSSCSVGATCAGTSSEAKTVIDYGPQLAGTANNLAPASVTSKSGDNVVSASTTFGYDAIGNLTSADGPLAGTADTSVFRYDADRRLVGTISPDPDGAGPRARLANKTTYNGRGIVTLAEIGSVNGTTDSDWAAFNSYEQVASALDSAGRAVKSTTSAGGATVSVVQYSYDINGRPECTALRMNNAAWGSLPSSACVLGSSGSAGADRITKVSYDAAGRPTKVQTGLGTSEQSDSSTATFNANGTVAALTDANNNKTTYEYDGVDRLLKTRYPSGNKGSGTSSTTDYEQLTYDANGNVTNKRLRDGVTVAFGVDDLNRVTSRTENGSLARQYGYDLLSQPTSSSWPGGSSPETMTYDALGRLTSRAEPYTTLSYQYDPAGRRTRVTWPDGLYISYNYDLLDKMTTVLENGSTTLATYGYDDLGRRTSLTRGNGTATYYSYDGASRLTCLRFDLAGGGALDCNPTASGQDNAITFGYNPAGQIVSRTSANTAYAWTGSANVNRAYTTNGLNQYTASGSVALGYDGRGNLNASGSSTYGYDAVNHLTTANGTASLLEYGSLDELQGYNLPSSYPRFASDGGNIVSEYLWGSPITLQRRYVYGASADEPLVWYEGTGTSDKRWLMADERGSVVAVANASGGASSINSYDEYGIPAASNQGRFQYTGQAWLSEVGLYSYKARMYSPTLGRFMQTDPIGYGDGMNWYNYAAVDPINNRDPLGTNCSSTSSNEKGDVDATIVICGGGGFGDLINPGPFFPRDSGSGFSDTDIIVIAAWKRGSIDGKTLRYNVYDGTEFLFYGYRDGLVDADPKMEERDCGGSNSIQAFPQVPLDPNRILNFLLHGHQPGAVLNRGSVYPGSGDGATAAVSNVTNYMLSPKDIWAIRPAMRRGTVDIDHIQGNTPFPESAQRALRDNAARAWAFKKSGQSAGKICK